MASTVTSKGQTTIPKAIRERLNLKPGDRVDFVVEDDGRALLVPATVHLSQLKGILPKPSKTVTIDDMAAAVAAESVKRTRDAR